MVGTKEFILSYFSIKLFTTIFSTFDLLTLGRLKTLQTLQTFCQLNYSIIILTKKTPLWGL